MSFNIRLIQLIHYLNENPTSFGNKLESTTGENIRLLTKNEEANPGLNILSEILKKYPEINSRWLLTGDGKMLIKPETKETIFKTAAETVKMDVAEESYERKCPVCETKDKLILSYEKQIELLEFNLGKYRKNGSR